MKMAEWFAMGGYAGFIWPVYGATVIALVGLAVWSWRDYRRAKAAAPSSRDDKSK